MIVRQDYFTLSMRLLTEDTQSELVAEQFTATRGSTYQLWAVYFCEARPNRQPITITPHYGAMRLECIGRGEEMRLVGCYWVHGDFSDGSLTLHDRKPEWFGDFESAKTAYG
jgi:hypothetical protein